MMMITRKKILSLNIHDDDYKDNNSILEYVQMRRDSRRLGALLTLHTSHFYLHHHHHEHRHHHHDHHDHHLHDQHNHHHHHY